MHGVTGDIVDDALENVEFLLPPFGGDHRADEGRQQVVPDFFAVSQRLDFVLFVLFLKKDRSERR